MTVLQRHIDEVMNIGNGVEWSMSIRDTAGREVASCNAHRAMNTASVGKLLLLIEVARQRDEGGLSGATLLGREPGRWVADSGVWQHLRVEALAVDDLCVLVASVSDNLATNVLLEHVGLPAVRELAATLGLVDTALLDRVRDHRGPNDPPTLSTGSASEWSRVMSELSRNELISPALSAQVNAWLATGVDLSMVGSAFGLDPLAHGPSDGNILIRNKTGAERGVRADVGSISHDATCFCYAVIANWDGPDASLRELALSGMNRVGAALRTFLDGAGR